MSRALANVVLATLDTEMVWLIVAVVGIPVLFLVITRWRSWLRGNLVGPLLWYDLARLARRNRTTLLRFTYGLLLLAWLYLVFADRYPYYVSISRFFEPGPRLAPRDLASLALEVVAGVMAVQGAAVFIITPAYLASAIAEERERGTLELLFATPLSNREIILGKLFGRLMHMGMILLTGLPILALVRLWGGIDGGVLLASFMITALTMLSVASVSMLCSVLAPNVLAAVISSYVAVAMLGAFSFGYPAASPLTFLTEYEREYAHALQEWQNTFTNLAGLVKPPPQPDGTIILLTLLAPAVALHGLLFFVSVTASITSLRGLGPDPARARSPLLGRADWGPFDEPDIYAKRTAGGFYYPRRPVCDPPLLWKEVYHGLVGLTGPIIPDLPYGAWPLLLLFSAALASFCIILHVEFPEEMTQLTIGLNYLIRSLTIACAGIWCVAAAFRAAVSVVRERIQKTLEGLFLLPVERREILWAKWLGSILRLRVFGFCLLGLWALGLLTGALHPWAVLLLAAGCGAYLAFLTSIGICLSMFNRNVLWANLSMALVLLLMTVATLIHPDRYVSREIGNATFTLAELGFNPVLGWWMSGFTWDELVSRIRAEDPLLWPTLTRVLSGICILALAAWLLWKLACIRFVRGLEPRRY